MSDPILGPSEKKRLEQDEKTVMAMAAVFCRGHHHICAQGEKLCPECAKVIDYSLDAAPISTAELATPAPPNAIDLPCGKKPRKSWPTVDLG